MGTFDGDKLGVERGSGVGLYDGTAGEGMLFGSDSRVVAILAADITG